MRKCLIGFMLIALSVGCTKIVTKKEIEYVLVYDQVAYVEKLSIPRPDKDLLKIGVKDGFFMATPDQMMAIATHVKGMNIMVTKQREIIDSHNRYLKKLNERKGAEGNWWE